MITKNIENAPIASVNFQSYAELQAQVNAMQAAYANRSFGYKLIVFEQPKQAVNLLDPDSLIKAKNARVELSNATNATKPDSAGVLANALKSLGL